MGRVESGEDEQKQKQRANSPEVWRPESHSGDGRSCIDDDLKVG